MAFGVALDEIGTAGLEQMADHRVGHVTADVSVPSAGIEVKMKAEERVFAGEAARLLCVCWGSEHKGRGGSEKLSS